MSVYTKVAVSERLYSDLKRVSRDTGRRLGVVSTDYFNEMIANNVVFDMDRTDLTVSAKGLDLDALKQLAGRSNLTVKDYVKRYSKLYPIK